MGRNVLIVEDDESIREALAEALLHDDYGVQVAENGEVGLARLKAEPRADLIILDLTMPVMDGWQFMRKWQNTPEISDIPVIVLSALATRDNAVGATDFIKKPVDLNVLFSKIEQWLPQ